MQEDNSTVNNAPAIDESDRTMSLMGGVVRPEDLPEADLDLESMKSGNKFLGQGSLLIVLVLIIAAGTLYGMRVSQGEFTSDGTTKEIEQKIEDALLRLGDPNKIAESDPLRQENLKSLFETTDTIVEVFAVDPAEHQVPIEFVKKNPFTLPIYRSLVEEEDDIPDEPVVDPRIERLKKLGKEFSKMKLQSIMNGARPVAIINKDFVQPGQTLGSFVVTRITQFSVDLEAEGETFTLEMEEGPERY